MKTLTAPRLKTTLPRLSVQQRSFKDLKPHLKKLKIAKKGIQRDTFSAVYKGRPVIVKLWVDPAILPYLAKEVRITGRLQKFPFIARLIEVGKDYFIQEKVPGKTFMEYLAGARKTDPVKILSTLASAAIMESLIQREGFSHNDLHPGNIVMSPNGVVIIDFGIAVEREVNPKTFRGAMVQDLFDVIVLSYAAIDTLQLESSLISELISANRRYAANVFDINEDTIGQYGRELLGIAAKI